MYLLNLSLVFDQLPGNYLLLAPNAPDFTIMGFNQTRATSTMTDASILGKALFEVFIDNPGNPKATGVANLRSSLLQVLETGQPHYMDIQPYALQHPVTKQFEDRYYKPVNIPVMDEQGRIHCIIHSVEDVTETINLKNKDRQTAFEIKRMREQQEEQLKISEQEYRYLFSHSPACILIWTLDDLAIQEANNSAIQQYGFSHSELLEKNVLELCPVEEHERMLSKTTEIKHSGAISSGIWKRQNKKGEFLYMDLVYHRINYKGKAAVLSLGINVTERILLQQKLDEERKRRINEITEAVLTTQEHERSELGKELHDNINQILTTSRLFIEHAISKKQKQNTEELLQQSCKYLSRAIEEIRQLSRTLNLPVIGEFSLREDLEELFSNIKQLKGIEFKFDFMVSASTTIPPPLRLAIFRIVQEKLNNIIRHAKATNAEIGIFEKKNELHLLIHDNGVGFRKEQLLRGMGLRNIKSRADLLGGQVEIQSSQENGTRLKIIFPLNH